MTTLKIAMHGVTGRMGSNQHFVRSILEIMKQGGVTLSSGETILIDPILVGRNKDKLKHLAETVATSVIGRSVEYSTDIQGVIAEPSTDIVFDSSSTQLRGSVIRRAIAHQKPIYCEKTVSSDVVEAKRLATECEAAGIKNGVVHDKLWLPGICKLRRLRDQGFFGRVLSVRAEFGYWVFTGHDANRPAQRPSWNNRREDGGGMMTDMFCHWHYLIHDLFGPIRSVCAHAVTDIPERVDEVGKPYRCTADDSAYAIFVLQNGVTCQFNSSWTTRVRRDDLLTIQVDGTNGSAVAGLRKCSIQPATTTPRPTWDPDVPQPINFYDGWQQVTDSATFDNAFKIQWELFLRHVAGDGDFPWSMRSGADGVALAAAGRESSDQKRWVDLN